MELFKLDEYLAYVSKIENLKDDIKKSLDFVKWKKHVKKDSTVFLKPNFTYPYYKEGITTSPELLKYLLEILKDRADNVFLGESDGGNHSFTANESLEGHQMPEICRDTGVEMVNLSNIEAKFVEDNINGKNVKVQLPKLLIEDIDCFISVPVLKVHVMTHVTLSMKNLWGCYPDTMRGLYHKNLSEKLTLITKVLNPKLVVMDGVYALDGHGPMYGEPKKLDLILSSNNPVVIDSLGANIMGIPVEKAEHVIVAEKDGIGTTNLNNVTINDDWTKFKMQFSVNKTVIDSLSTLLFKSETIAKLVMNSPVTPLIYGCAKFLRNPKEKEVVNEMERYYK